MIHDISTFLFFLALTVLLGTCFLLVLQPVNAISANNFIVPSEKTIQPKSSPFNNILIRQFLHLTPKKYYAMTGKRMSLSQKISLKIAQYKVKRMIKKGKPVDLVAMSKDIDTSDFNIAGLILGLLLSLIGVLIAYLIDDSDSSMIKWAWIGAGIGAILILLALII
jgi:hypothetical protein